MNILLFPGSFAPFTDGHYGLIARYLNAAKNQNTPIDKVVIFLSKNPREGIDYKSSYKLISQIYSNDKRIEIQVCEKSPINEVYAYVYKNQKTPNNYIFLRSDKDDDNLAEEFKKKFENESDNIKILELKDVSREPIIYKNRKDEYNNKVISASVVRNDIRNKDFNSFLTSYQNIMKNEITLNENHLKNFFNGWVKVIEPISKDSKGIS